MNWKDVYRQLVVQQIAKWRNCHLPIMRKYYRAEVRRAIQYYRRAGA